MPATHHHQHVPGSSIGSGAPHASSSRTTLTLGQLHRPNPRGSTAYERERQVAAYSRLEPLPAGRTEWDVLKENHRWAGVDSMTSSRLSTGSSETTRLRGMCHGKNAWLGLTNRSCSRNSPWCVYLARGVRLHLGPAKSKQIDLKHYKSRRLALRWRTAPEVVDGTGELTCASLRCDHHAVADEPPKLRSFELPFVYEEEGKRKEALVKVRLCRRCEGKLRWKPRDERGATEDEVGTARGKEDRGRYDEDPRGSSNRAADVSGEERDRRKQRRSRSPGPRETPDR